MKRSVSISSRIRTRLRRNEESGYHLDPNELASVTKLKASDLAVNIKHGPGAVATYELDVRSAKI
jgi:hypothetical protein